MKEQSRTKMLAHDIPLRVVKLLNVILMTIPFAWCWYGYYVGQMENSFYKKGNLLMLVLFMLVYFMFARVYSAFLVSVNRISEMVYSQVLAVLITDGITYLVIVLLVKGFPSVIPGLLAIAGQTAISFVWCTLAHLWYFRTFPPQKTMIVYDVREGMEKLISQYDMQKKFKVEEVLQVEECLNDMKKLDEMETVFLSGIHSRERNIILKYCIDRHVRVYVIPRVGDVLMSGAKQIHMFHLPMLSDWKIRSTAGIPFPETTGGYRLCRCCDHYIVTDHAYYSNCDQSLRWRPCFLLTDPSDQKRERVWRAEIPLHESKCRERWCGASFKR